MWQNSFEAIQNFPALVFTISRGNAADSSYNQSDYGSSVRVKPPPQLNYAICFNTLWQHQYWWMLSDQHLVVLSLYNVLFQKNLTTSDESTHFAWILSSRFQLRLNHQLYLRLLSIELLSINFKHIHHHRVYNVTKIDPDKEWVRKHEGSRHRWY